MANRQEIEAMYNWVDDFQKMFLGEKSDYTCAFFNGDFTKTLDEAQRDKHEYALKGINFKRGDRVLDIGSGWGPILQAVRDRGGKAVGLTLSSAQVRYCKKHGLDARLEDYKEVDPKEIGKFDGIVSIGAFEHFCSLKEFTEGKQDQIYKDFFKFCYDLLPKGGRLYLHTMVWGKKVPDPKKISLKAPKDSDELILARATKFYPGSWLPAGKDQITQDAKPYFKFISTKNGRLDYIETLSRWGQSIKPFYTTRKMVYAFFKAAKLAPRYLYSPDFRAQIAFIKNSGQTELFKREIFSHERMFFEKI